MSCPSPSDTSDSDILAFLSPDAVVSEQTEKPRKRAAVQPESPARASAPPGDAPVVKKQRPSKPSSRPSAAPQAAAAPPAAPQRKSAPVAVTHIPNALWTYVSYPEIPNYASSTIVLAPSRSAAVDLAANLTTVPPLLSDDEKTDYTSTLGNTLKPIDLARPCAYWLHETEFFEAEYCHIAGRGDCEGTEDDVTDDVVVPVRYEVADSLNVYVAMCHAKIRPHGLSMLIVAHDEGEARRLGMHRFAHPVNCPVNMSATNTPSIVFSDYTLSRVWLGGAPRVYKLSYRQRPLAAAPACV